MKRWIALTVVMCMLMVRASSAAQKYTLKADLNEDNVVNLIDLAILTEDWLQTDGVIAQDLLHNTVFSRSSIAFLDGKEYAPNAPRKKTN